jgi:hypothetical protein
MLSLNTLCPLWFWTSRCQCGYPSVRSMQPESFKHKPLVDTQSCSRSSVGETAPVDLDGRAEVDHPTVDGVNSIVEVVGAGNDRRPQQLTSEAGGAASNSGGPTRSPTSAGARHNYVTHRNIITLGAPALSRVDAATEIISPRYRSGECVGARRCVGRRGAALSDPSEAGFITATIVS